MEKIFRFPIYIHDIIEDQRSQLIDRKLPENNIIFAPYIREWLEQNTPDFKIVRELYSHYGHCGYFLAFNEEYQAMAFRLTFGRSPYKGKIYRHFYEKAV